MRKKRGSAVLEFTLAGIPAIFLWISIAQMALGMWRYHVLEYAVKVTNAYVAVHGSGCNTPNTCQKQIKDAAEVFKQTAVGVPAADVTVTFTVLKPDHVTASETAVTCRLTDCLTDTTRWPPSGWWDPGYDTRVHANYTNAAFFKLFSPAAVAVGDYTFPAESQQMILF